ncbi:hypothetical protein CERSUDRAFT_119376 [Gelatoporia subvermispora B]|uniref:G protein-coupled receptor n=1 Tax=Ceriporiopsis subvermispora (strain B) TaxID=914234 RepID=M2QI86_CERS8|nr:hypothetical protein CERSUDRAFT_119376 [Gelatoporia subvermispora B]
MSSFFQNSYYIGINVNAILYGVELVLYFQTMGMLFRDGRAKMTTSDKFFACFSTALMFLITIYMSTEAVFGEEMWIVHASDPGGPALYFEENASIWYQTWGTASGVVLNWMTDGLMIYRCYVVWNSFYIVIFPIFLFMSTWGLGILEIWASGSPGANFFKGNAARIVLAYFSTTIGLNVLTTILICIRILSQAKRVEGVLGRTGSRMYTNASALIIESALPYAAGGIASVISMGLNSDISVLMGSFYIMFACISPQLLILRVLKGRVWTRETTSAFPTTFAAAPSSGLTDSTRGMAESEIALEQISKGRILVSTTISDDPKHETTLFRDV